MGSRVSRNKNQAKEIPKIPAHAFDLSPTDAWNEIAERGCETSPGLQPYKKLDVTKFSSPGDKPANHVRFVVISDTHSTERRFPGRLHVPDGDVLLHTGDFTDTGKPE